MSDKRIIPKSGGKVVFVPYAESFGTGKDRSKSRTRKKRKRKLAREAISHQREHRFVGDVRTLFQKKTMTRENT
ncbi:MAG: hypothetical protein ACI4JA_06715 [Oscillospiraceae bacterium]